MLAIVHTSSRYRQWVAVLALLVVLLQISSTENIELDLKSSDIIKELETSRRIKRFANLTDPPDYGESGYINIKPDYDAYYKGPVCDLIDERNDPTRLQNYENCEIINGFLHLAFMHDNTEEQWKHYRFPKLREITHYLLIFRIYGLKSLRNVFPKLSVIGGKVLLKGYSLIVYENPDLLELGLDNLQHISNGRVRVQKNGQLCYLGTVNWQQLDLLQGNKDVGEPFLLDNRDQSKNSECINDCGKCKSDNCWGYNVCQKDECPSECSNACMNGKCTCHDECLVGCSSPNNASACFACYNKYYDGKCVNKCPEGTYEFEGWYCISASVCSNSYNYFTHEGLCAKNCPPGYEVDVESYDLSCIKCRDDCGKVCYGDKKITTLASIEDVFGCKIIVGRLTISITGGSEVVQALDEALSSLVEVQALIILRSFPLISLSFLKNLKLISGEDHYLYDNVYSVYILDNQNLEELWDFTFPNGTSKLSIGGGKALFHFNSKLCPDRIDKISILTNEVEDGTDISEASNGDRTTCVMEELRAVTFRNSTNHLTEDSAAVKVFWLSFNKIKDYRTLIGYQIFYKLSPEQNARHYQGVDACGTSDWGILDVAKDVREDGSTLQIRLNTIIKGLKPFKQYAVYVRAYMTSSASMGAQSKMLYFTSQAINPSSPERLTATPTQDGGDNSIDLWWQPPREANGILTYYIVRWLRQPEHIMRDEMNEACDPSVSYRIVSGVQHHHSSEPAVTEAPLQSHTPDKPIIDGETCCECKKIDLTEEDVEETRQFENFLHDVLFFKPEPPPESISDEYDDFGPGPVSRKKRFVAGGNSTATQGNVTTVTTAPATMVPKTLNYEWHFAKVIANSTSFVITGLHYFTEFEIQIWACNHISNSELIDEKFYPNTGCSNVPAIISKRTSANDTVDKIKNLRLSTIQEHRNGNGKKTRHTLSWIPPQQPNGYMLYYKIEIMSKKSKSATQEYCFEHTRFLLANKVYIIPQTQPGEYTARVQPHSLKGEGSWSAYVDFKVAEEKTNHTYLLAIGAALFVILVALALVGVYYKKKLKDIADHATVTTHNHDYVPSNIPYIPDAYEVDEERIEVLHEIGHGNFGKVFAGFAKGVVAGEKKTKVAIKKLHSNASIDKRYEFLQEATKMKCFDSYHVVRLIGVVSKSPDTMVIMEFMERGDLKTYLRSLRPDSEENPNNLSPPTLQEKLQMAAEIADGMAYLAEVKFVHRDLAARNCLVSGLGVVKISDFGLTRDIYETDYYRKESRGFLPIRWMAPESLKDGVFDSGSDVWSYGIVLWELATLAEQPYYGRSHDEVTKLVIDGGFMEQPRNCPRKLYDLMLMCWQYHPNMRPCFIEIVKSLIPDVNQFFTENSYWGKQMNQPPPEGSVEMLDFAQSELSLMNENEYHQQHTLPAHKKKVPPFPAADTPYDYFNSSTSADHSPNSTHVTSVDTSFGAKRSGSTGSLYDMEEQSSLLPKNNGKIDAQYSRLNGVKLLQSKQSDDRQDEGVQFRDHAHLLSR